MQEAAVPPGDAAPRIFGRVPPVLVALDDAVLGGHPDKLEATIVTQQGHENARIKVPVPLRCESPCLRIFEKMRD